mgnify:CR=1 FL=1
MQQITPSRIIFDGHEAHQTCEGPKMYKRNDYYYTSIRQVVYRQAGRSYYVLKNSTVLTNGKQVLAQGNSPVNGPHQGAWVDTPTGEDWIPPLSGCRRLRTYYASPTDEVGERLACDRYR